MKSLYAFMVCAVLVLVGCGGGGGGGGGNTPSITLRGGDEPVQRHGVQVLDTTNLVLDQKTYTAFIDGQETLVGAGMDGELILVLPVGLSAGVHELRINLADRDFVIPFTVAPAVIAPAEDSLAVIEQIFTEARLAIDTQIDILIGLDADQSIIDDLLAKRAQLDTGSEEFQSLSAEELDYLSKLLTNLLADEVAARRALFTLPPGCNAPQYILKFVRFATGAAVTGIVAANVSVFGTPILGVIVGGVLLADTLARIRPLAEEFVELWPKCIDPITSKIASFSTVRARSRSAATRSTVFNVEEDVINFLVETPETYEMETKFDVFQGLVEHFPDIRKFVSDFAFIIPDSVEGFILERTAEDYAEAVDPADIVLLGITAPNVIGEINPVDERRFSITFFVNGPFDGDPIFDFVLHNTRHDIQTQYTANLSVPEHCPMIMPGNGFIAEGADRCFHIQEKSEFEGPGIYYREYRYGVPLLFESYSGFGGSSLKASKGLENYDQLPDYLVGLPELATQFQVFSDGEFHLSVPELQTQRSGEFTTVWEYSAPVEVNPGFWVSFVVFQTGYQGAQIIAESENTDPLQDASGDWRTVVVRVSSYSIDGVLISNIVHTAPQQTSTGEWASVPAEDKKFWPSGELKEHRIYTTRESGSNVLMNLLSSYTYFEEAGWLKRVVVYNDPVQRTDGEWEELESYDATYVIDGFLNREVQYTEPFLAPSGEWTVVPVRELVHTGFLGAIGEGYMARVQEFWAYELSADNEIVVPLAREEQLLNEEVVGYADYSEPVQGSDGYWYTVNVGTSLNYNYFTGIETESDYSGAPLVHPVNGSMLSLPDEIRIYESGVMTTRVVYHDAAYDVTSQSWRRPESLRYLYSAEGVLEYEEINSDVLFGSDQRPQVVIQLGKNWSGGVLQSTAKFSAPFMTGGSWASYLQRVDNHLQDCYTTYNQQGEVVQNTCM